METLFHTYNVRRYVEPHTSQPDRHMYAKSITVTFNLKNIHCLKGQWDLKRTPIVAKPLKFIIFPTIITDLAENPWVCYDIVYLICGLSPQWKRMMLNSVGFPSLFIFPFLTRQCTTKHRTSLFLKTGRFWLSYVLPSRRPHLPYAPVYRKYPFFIWDHQGDEERLPVLHL